jgi:hypothetical protein
MADLRWRNIAFWAGQLLAEERRRSPDDECRVCASIGPAKRITPVARAVAWQHR